MNIQEFARDYKDAGYPSNPGLMRKTYLTDVSTSTLVWDEGEFLVELYFMHPLVKVVPHSHPFESVAIYIGGAIKGRREAAFGDWLNSQSAGDISSTLQIGDWHAFETGADGVVLYSISKWADQAQKESATLRYVGKPLGPVHKATLDQIRKK